MAVHSSSLYRVQVTALSIDLFLIFINCGKCLLVVSLRILASSTPSIGMLLNLIEQHHLNFVLLLVSTMRTNKEEAQYYTRVTWKASKDNPEKASFTQCSLIS